jgi:acetylornithine deacetylase
MRPSLDLTSLTADAIELLKGLIRIQSFSGEEQGTAALIAQRFEAWGLKPLRDGNNVWAINKHFDPAKPTLLLNSHHDTVRPNASYTRDPYSPDIVEGKLYGLGSNDAGGALVSLMATFRQFYERTDLSHNLVIAATAEEENSGFNGLERVVPQLPPIAWALVGEPTLMQLAIAERGLMVLDCTAVGRAGHAAREEGDNALYRAVDDIAWFRSYAYPKVSTLLGPVKQTVTVIEAGRLHNVVPDRCTFTVDVRLNELYTHDEVLGIIRANVRSEVVPRSTRLKSSSIPVDHPIVKQGLALGRTTYGSPTCSDQAILRVPSLKVGPGDSARSHTADEFIYVSELEEAVQLYIALLTPVITTRA